MFGLHVKFLILRTIAWSVLDRLVNTVVNVDCPGIFLSMLVTCCPKRQRFLEEYRNDVVWIGYWLITDISVSVGANVTMYKSRQPYNREAHMRC